MTYLDRQRAVGRLAACLLLFTVAACGTSDPVPESAQPTSASASAQAATAEADASQSALAEATFDPELYIPSMVDCLRDAGWDAEVIPPGDGISVNHPPDQGDAYREAFEECNQLVGPAPPPRQLSEAEIRDHYDLLLGARDCLIAAGFDVSEPQSVDAFVETYYSGGSWSPYQDIEIGFERAIEECPQP